MFLTSRPAQGLRRAFPTLQGPYPQLAILEIALFPAIQPPPSAPREEQEHIDSIPQCMWCEGRLADETRRTVSLAADLGS
jgi:hypothetical protein